MAGTSPTKARSSTSNSANGSASQTWPPRPDLFVAAVLRNLQNLPGPVVSGVLTSVNNANANSNIKGLPTPEAENEHFRIAEAFINATEEIKNSHRQPPVLQLTIPNYEDEIPWVSVNTLKEQNGDIDAALQALLSESDDDEDRLLQKREQRKKLKLNTRPTRKNSSSNMLSPITSPQLGPERSPSLSNADLLTQALCDLSLALNHDPSQDQLNGRNDHVNSNSKRGTVSPQQPPPQQLSWSAEAMARRFLVACSSSSVDVDATLAAAMKDAMRSTLTKRQVPELIPLQPTSTLQLPQENVPSEDDDVGRQRAFSSGSNDSDSDTEEELESTAGDNPADESWPQPRMQLYYQLFPKSGQVQNDPGRGRCYNCGKRIDGVLRGGRYCEYTGKYFCRTCHLGERSMIPARILQAWDFRLYRVSARAKEFIENIWSEPIFDVSVFHNELYGKIKALGSMKVLRTQLSYLRDYLSTCRNNDQLLQRTFADCMHLVNSVDHYSLQDLVEVESGTLTLFLMTATKRLIAHIYDCEVCKERGFICEFCRSNKILYPFQLNTVTQCPTCKSFFHKTCYVATQCPKCMRLEGHRLRNIAQATTNTKR